MLHLLLIVCLIRFVASSGENITQNTTCSFDEFSCSNGSCIARHLWCNGDVDCDGGTDEIYCKKKFTSYWTGKLYRDPNDCEKQETLFLCESGECYPKSIKCDGIEDCRDESDETNCTATDVEIGTAETEKTEENTVTFGNGTTSLTTTDYDYEFSSSQNTTTTSTRESTIYLSSPYQQHTTSIPPRSTKFTEIEKKIRNNRVFTPTSTTTTTASISTHVPIYKFTTPFRGYRQEGSWFDSTPRSAKISVSPHDISSPTKLVGATTLKEKWSSKATTLEGEWGSKATMMTYRPTITTELSRRRFIRTTHSPRLFSKHKPGHHNSISNRRYSTKSGPSPVIARETYRTIVSSIHQDNKKWRPFYAKENTPLMPFNFSSHYALRYENKHWSLIDKSRQWILDQRNSDGGWGSDTVRAIAGLALSQTHASDVNVTSFEIMKTYFLVHVGTYLIRNDLASINPYILALFIQGSLAICQDPRDFLGLDLPLLLRHRIGVMPFVHPAIHLALCLGSDRGLEYSDVRSLSRFLNSESIPPGDKRKDYASLAMVALSCHLQHMDDSPYKDAQKNVLEESVRLLLGKGHNGSYGSIYSTALVAQAAMSADVEWDAEPTFDILRENQLEDGSFGGFLAAFRVLPVLNGKSPLHLRNVQCPDHSHDSDIWRGDRHVQYLLRVGVPLDHSISITLKVADGTSLLTIMQLAQQNDERYKFDEDSEDGLKTLSNLPNDPERGFFWHLYLGSGSTMRKVPITQDLKNFFLKSSDDAIVFWYHSFDIKPTFP